MMIEPPRKARIGAVFEINNRVFVAVELILIESVTGAMHRWRVMDFSRIVNFREVKFGKNRG
jgi:hypothetical protein